jgi:hypothetical protein
LIIQLFINRRICASFYSEAPDEETRAFTQHLTMRDAKMSR